MEWKVFLIPHKKKETFHHLHFSIRKQEEEENKKFFRVIILILYKEKHLPLPHYSMLLSHFDMNERREEHRSTSSPSVMKLCCAVLVLAGWLVVNEME